MNSVPAFKERSLAWSSPPLDDIGYLPSGDLMKMSDEALRHLIAQCERNRYGGWRNWRGNWRRLLGLDTTTGKRVLDYGCGIGIEALQYARKNNTVAVADISPGNVQLAERVLVLHGFAAEPVSVKAHPPFALIKKESFDVVHCNGVLHHIPQPKPVVKQMAQWLTAGGELRLMVYSDHAWRIATRTEPPLYEPQFHDRFERYWQHWDPIGGYADWYDEARLTKRFGQWFDVTRCEYLTEHSEYLGAVLVKRQ